MGQEESTHQIDHHCDWYCWAQLTAWLKVDVVLVVLVVLVVSMTVELAVVRSPTPPVVVTVSGCVRQY